MKVVLSIYDLKLDVPPRAHISLLAALLRCTDCENTPEDGFDRRDNGEDDMVVLGALDSLASAAQLASGCYEDTAALLTPRMLASVAPYNPPKANPLHPLASTAIKFHRPNIWIDNSRPPLLPPLATRTAADSHPPHFSDHAHSLKRQSGALSNLPLEEGSQGWEMPPPAKRVSCNGPALASEGPREVGTGRTACC